MCWPSENIPGSGRHTGDTEWEDRHRKRGTTTAHMTHLALLTQCGGHLLGCKPFDVVRACIRLAMEPHTLDRKTKITATVQALSEGMGWARVVSRGTRENRPAA